MADHQPEEYFRGKIRFIEQLPGLSEEHIDGLAFGVECFALSCGYQSFLPDLSKRVLKYLGKHLPDLMAGNLRLYFDAMAHGKSPNDAFLYTRKKGRQSNLTLDREIYDWVNKLIEQPDYSLIGGRKLLSAYEKVMEDHGLTRIFITIFWVPLFLDHLVRHANPLFTAAFSTRRTTF